MSDSLRKVSIPLPMPGMLPPRNWPGLPALPPGVHPPRDDPHQRIEDALRKAAAAQYEDEPPPPYTPNPMRNIEDDLSHHPGFFGEQDRTRYDPMHVENILDGATDILARALGDRAAYDAQRDRFYERTLELNYLQSQLDLDEVEFETGVWDRALKQAVAELESVDARYKGAIARSSARAEGLGKPEFAPEQQASLIAIAVRAGMSGTFQSPNQQIAKVGDQGEPGVATKDAHALVYEKNLESTKYSLLRERFSYELEEAGETEWQAALASQIELARSNIELEKKMKELRMDRFSALQAYQAERTKALTDLDGPHNTLIQMKAIQDRFGRDMVDLFDRLKVVALGLDLIYGLKNPLSTPTECAEKGLSFLDLSVAWVRNVVRFLNARATHDRTLTLSYSLRQLVEEQAFQDALDRALEDGSAITMSFTIPLPSDRELRFPRLRGVSCYSLYSGPDTYNGVFSLYLDPPSYAYMSLEKARVPFLEPRTWPNATLNQVISTSVGGNDARPWDDTPIFTRWGTKLVRIQKNLTPAFVSRIAPRYPLRAPEIFATDSLFNLSPFSAPNADGEGDAVWTIVIDAKTTTGTKVASILKDLEIDLYLLATPEFT